MLSKDSNYLKFPVFSDTSTSLVKKHLSFDLFEKLYTQKTDSGFTIKKAVQSGVLNPDSTIGIYAGDAQTYETYSKIFEPVIFEYHGISKTGSHLSDFSPMDLPPVDPKNNFILSTRIRVARNLKLFPFTPHITLFQRKKVESRIKSVLADLKGEFKGRYISLEKLCEQERQTLLKQKQIFKIGDRFQDAAGINSDFPKGRGIFHSNDNRFMVWINEEDHLRIISMDLGSDISGTFNRLERALALIKKSLDFAYDSRFGNLTSCPSNVGTAMRAGVHIRLKSLEKNPDLLKRIAKAHHLQVRGTAGEKTGVCESVFDISNRRRLGLTKTQCVQHLYQGCKAIIQAEINPYQSFFK
jgi:protein-arginine kinase